MDAHCLHPRHRPGTSLHQLPGRRPNPRMHRLLFTVHRLDQSPRHTAPRLAPPPVPSPRPESPQGDSDDRKWHHALLAARESIAGIEGMLSSQEMIEACRMTTAGGADGPLHPLQRRRTPQRDDNGPRGEVQACHGNVCAHMRVLRQCNGASRLSVDAFFLVPLRYPWR